MNVLSIQSYVATGHVGNSAAVFCLQRMGIDVSGVNTLQFSNHSGAPFQGDVFSADHISRVINGIDEFSHFDDCRAVLSGYLGRAETGDVVINAVERVKKRNPNALYCCDPVMGDDGEGFFVKPEVASFFLQKAVNVADILTPNVFELEFLSKEKLFFVQNIASAASSLIQQHGLKMVVVTGIRGRDFHENETGALAVNTTEAFLVKTPRVAFQQPLTGTGDAFAALFLGSFLMNGNMKQALSYATSCLFSIIQKTPDLPGRTPAFIENQNEISVPSHRFDAERIFL